MRLNVFTVAGLMGPRPLLMIGGEGESRRGLEGTVKRVGRKMRPLRQAPEFRRLAMHKFSPELDRNWFGWILISKDTTANAIAGFEHDYRLASAAEVTRGSQTGRARTDDQNIRFCFCHLRRS